MGEDGFVASAVVWHAALYPKLREVAYRHGYALALHGSLTKDLDVLAVPWVEHASPEVELVRSLVECAGGFLTETTPKPHGRVVYTIVLGEGGGYVDLSVVPREVTPSAAGGGSPLLGGEVAPALPPAASTSDRILELTELPDGATGADALHRLLQIRELVGVPDAG